MKAAKWCLTGLGLATAVLTTGCLCNFPDDHAVTFSAGNEGLTLVVDGAPRRVPVETHLTSNQLSSAALDDVVDALEGSRDGEGVALSFSGFDSMTNEFVAFTLALPVSLQQGDEYPVGATFTVDLSVPDPQMWGAHDLQTSNQADVAFAVATYTFPPPAYSVNFRAVSSSGTIRVTERESGRVALSLNLSFADAAGTTRSVTGVVRANLETIHPRCA